MSGHALAVFLDAGYVLTALFAFAVAASRIMIARLTRKSSKLALFLAIVFAVFLIFAIYELFSDISSPAAINSPPGTNNMAAYGFLIGNLILPLILGVYYARDNIRRLIRLGRERQEYLQQLKLQELALDHPEAAATVEALMSELDKQSRSATLQNIVLGALFYVLGVITPYIITTITR